MAGGNEDRREMRALLLNFGANLWTDEWSDKWNPLRAKVATDHLQLDEALWRETQPEETAPEEMTPEEPQDSAATPQNF